MSFKLMIPRWNGGKCTVPVRYEASPGESLQQEVNRFFDEVLGTWPSGPSIAGGWGGESGVFSPRVELAEDDKAVRIMAELPGLTEKEVTVSLADGVLTIRGEKKAEREEKETEYFATERSYGAFQRAFSLPVEVDEEKIEAAFTNGLLTVTLPKSAKAQQRVKTITVKGA